MAAALMTQWLFNFVIAKVNLPRPFLLYNETITNPFDQLTPIMLDTITFGTFLVFGCACLTMVVYAIFCVPETKGVPLESIFMLFEGNIIAGATRDTVPRFSRAKHLAHSATIDPNEHFRDDEEDGSSTRKDGSMSSHVERVNPAAKNAAYSANASGAA